MTRHLPLAALAAASVAVVLVQPQARVAAVEADQAAIGVTEFQLSPLIDSVTDLALDGRGNLVVVGSTFSPDFPTTPDAADRDCGADGDAFVQVFSRAGELRYSTCLGTDNAIEFLTRVAPAPDGSLWVVAYTGFLQEGRSGTMLWRVTPGVPGDRDAVRIGGPDAQSCCAYVVAAPDGSVWVAGVSSGDLPTVNAWQPTFGGQTDMFVGRYARGRADPLVLTYLGGTGSEFPSDLAVAPDGDVVVTGSSWGGQFPAVRPFQGANGGGWDCVVARLDGSGRWLEYSTYLGGSELEEYCRVDVDRLGNTYAAGRSGSADLPFTSRDTVLEPSSVFLAAIDPSGGLLFSAPVGFGLDASIPPDAYLQVEHAVVRRDRSVLVAGGYFSSGIQTDQSYREGWFVAVADAAGATILRPAGLGCPHGGTAKFDAAAAGPRDVFIAYHDSARWPVRTRAVVRVRVDAFERPLAAPAGGHDRR
jgi:hypothetical protein